MTLIGIFEVLTAFFKFPEQVVALVRLLRNTPEQDHLKLLQKVAEVFDEKANGGRPG
jgi:hypothetical protein